MMTIYEVLQTLGLDVSYGKHTKKVTPPYLMITGAGQDHFDADTTYYVTKDRYTIEYYYTKKDPELEKEIERLLLEHGRRYEKSEDVYIEDQDVFLIYYDI